MSIRFRQPPLELPPAWAELVDAIRDVVQRGRFASLDELALAMYRRPASSERRDGKRISELARGTRFPDAEELRTLINTCDPQAWSRIEPLLQAAVQERAAAQRVTSNAAPDPPSSMTVTDQTTSPAPSAVRRNRRFALAAGGITVLAVVVVIVVVLTTTRGVTGPGTGAGATSTTVISTTLPTTVSSAPPVPTRWSDDFTGPAIDTAKWDLDADNEVIYQRDGALHLTAPADKATTANPDGSNPRITARPEGKQIKEFSFQMTFTAATGDASGGAGGAVFDSARREYSAYVGPGGEVDTIAVAACLPSAEGEKCSSEAGPSIERGKPVQIRMVWSGNGVDLYADSAQPVYTWPATSAPTRAHFSLYADTGSVFEVVIDNVTIEFG